MYQSTQIPFGETKKAVIAHHFGRWAAYSALKSGRHVKSKKRVLDGLDAVCFTAIFDKTRGEIAEQDFDTWHRGAVAVMCQRISPTIKERFHEAYAAKAIAVYLKPCAIWLGMADQDWQT